MNISINTDGAAFHSEGDLVLDSYIMAEQLSAIFRNIIFKVREGYESGNELDINGNEVCQWEI